MNIIREFHFERILEAPRELVFEVWVNPDHLAKWWGPRGCTNTVHELDARQGGNILVQMEGEGYSHPMGGTYNEIIKPEKVVFTARAFKDAQGEYMVELVHTVTFEEYEGKTKMKLHTAAIKVAAPMMEAIEGMSEGTNSSLDKLEELVAVLSMTQ